MSNIEIFRKIVDRSITNLEIPNSVKSIGNSAFANCLNLTSITIPNSVTSIGNSAFLMVGSLKELTIPDSVTSIGSGAFINAASSSTLIFKQPFGAKITLPEAGSGTGLFYYKIATNKIIYTDNETIKNYDYAADNVTATIYHLDGSAWA